MGEMSKARGVVSLRLYYATACAVGGLYLPFFPRWLEARGMIGLRLGVIAAVAPAMNVLVPTAFGRLADVLKLRGGLLRFACAGALLAFGSLTAAVAAGLPIGFGALFVAALFFALFRSPMSFIADVVAIELAPAAGTSYGRLRLWGSLGFIVSVLGASRVVDPRDALAFPAATTLVVFGALLASLRLPAKAEIPAPAARGGAWTLLGDPDFRMFLAAIFLGQAGHVAYDLCFSLRLFDLGIHSTGLGVAWALGTGSEVVLMACSGPLLRVFAPTLTLAFALGAASLRWALIASVRSPGLLLLIQPLHAFSFGLYWVSAVGYTSRRFPPHSLATAQGLFATATGAGSVAGMLTWGTLYHRVGGSHVFAGAACVSAGACAMATALDHRARSGAGAAVSAARAGGITLD